MRYGGCDERLNKKRRVQGTSPDLEDERPKKSAVAACSRFFTQGGDSGEHRKRWALLVREKHGISGRKIQNGEKKKNTRKGLTRGPGLMGRN